MQRYFFTDHELNDYRAARKFREDVMKGSYYYYCPWETREILARMTFRTMLTVFWLKLWNRKYWNKTNYSEGAG